MYLSALPLAIGKTEETRHYDAPTINDPCGS